MSSLEILNGYVDVNIIDYESCISVVEHDYIIGGMAAKVRLHHLRFDGNGQPMVRPLASMLYTYIINYCLSARNREDKLTPQQAASLVKQARELFRRPDISPDDPDETGEAGEILLYFLIEAVLKAPQVVSKMELKTNRKDEVKGSDGIHARWNEVDALVDVFFGEAKLYKNSASAISAALKSINDFHEIKMYSHELAMVTKHFKFANEEVKSAISAMIIHGQPGPNIRINHACLIGYDFNGYSQCEGKHGDELLSAFAEVFLLDGKRLVGLLQKKLDAFPKKHLVFDVFFMPFPSVTEFRNEFNMALS